MLGSLSLFLKLHKLLKEEIDKNNIYYGNENESDIQQQPYILVVQRKPVREVRDMAREYRDRNLNNLTEQQIEGIISDMEFDYGSNQSKEETMKIIDIGCKYRTSKAVIIKRNEVSQCI